MTPRPDVEWVDLYDTPAAVRTQLAVAARDRFLVCEGELDRIVGLVHAEDLLVRCMEGQVVSEAATLRGMARPPVFVPSTMPAFRLLETFKRSRQHTAVVLDEYGAVAGVATLDDLLEALVGEVPDQEGGDDAAMTRRADGSWLIDASTAVEDVENRLDLAVPELERDGFRTLGGFVMARLGHLPRVGDAFQWSGRHVEVVSMDGRRIETVLVSPPPRADASPPATGGAG